MLQTTPDPKPATLRAPKLMFDLGAHKGDDSAFYLAKGWKVVAVEAHPALARECSSRFRNNLRNFRLEQKAITPAGESAHLFCSNKGSLGETHSIHPHRVKGCEDVGYTVPGTTLGRLLKKHGDPDYLKIDIEGADITAIQQLHAWKGTKPKHLSVELCWNHPEEALEIFAHLGYMGYSRFSLEVQHWNATVDVDTVGYWMTLREVSSGWFSKGRPPKDTWFDLHAIHHKDAHPDD